MSGANTSGYDLLLQVSRGSIDQGLARWIGTFPQAVQANISLPIKAPITGVPLGNASYRANIALSMPNLVSIQPPGPGAGARVTLRSTFSGDSALSLLVGIAGITLNTGVNLELRGSVDMQCDVALEDVAPPRAPAAGRAVVAKLDTATLTFAITGMTSLQIGQTLVGQPITVDNNTLRNALGPVQAALDNLLNTVGSVPLTWPIPLPGAGPTKSTRVAALDFSAFSGTPEGIGIGVSSQCGGTGNASGLRTNPGNIGGVARLLLANNWLVCFVADWLETVLLLPSPGFTGGGTTRTWTGSVGLTAPTGETMALTSLTVDVPPGGSGVRISGTGSASGFCWTAAPSFSATVRFTCGANGMLTPVVDPPVASSNVSVPWYCVLGAIVLALVVGALFGIIAAIVVGVVSAIVLALASMANPVSAATSALTTVLGLPIPLPVASIGIPCSLVQFDDLYVRGTPVYRDMVPTRSSGSVLLPAGATFNLDAGSVGGGGGDLSWSGGMLQALPGTQMVLLGGAFDDATYRQLQQITYPVTSIGSGSIPASPSAPLVFGTRTGDGMYARVAVRRSGTSLELKWVTYARPRASLTVETIATITDSKEVDSGTSSCGWVEVEPGPSINQILEAGAILSGGGGDGDPIPWNPYAGAGDFGFTPEPDGGIGGGFNLPTIQDVFNDRRNRPTTRVTPHTTSVPWTEKEYAHRIVCRAQAALITYPATYSWTVLGQALPATSGTTTIGGATVTVDENDPASIVIETGLGGVVSGQVCCTAVDANGRTVSGCTTVRTQARYREGGDCRQGQMGTLGGRAPINLLDLFVNGHELAGVVASSRAAARKMGAAVAAATPPPAEGPPPSFKEALLAASAPAKKRGSSRGPRSR
jgi:hypothetical protein